MYWRSALITAAAAGAFLLVGRTSAPPSGLVGATDPPGKLPVEVAPPPRLAFAYTSFQGRLIEIGKDSITVQGFAVSGGSVRTEYDRRKGRITWTPWPPDKTLTLSFGPLGPKHDIKGEVKPGNHGIDSGPSWDISAVRAAWTREEITITHPDGKVTVLRRADEPPWTLGVHWSYTVGGFPDDLSLIGPVTTYRLEDLRVGDEVRLGFNHGVVHGIRIEQRPGGQIPLAPGEDPKWGIRDRMQAYQDWEEKGTPIPWKFLSPDEREERIAPPPREVLPRIPPAKK